MRDRAILGSLKTFFTCFFLSLIFFIPEISGYPKAESSYVNDFAGVLSSADKKEIKNALFNFRKKNRIPVVLVTINTLDGEDVNMYATELGNAWKVGLDGKSNGYVILFAYNDRKISLQAGRDIRTAIDSSARKRIIKNMVQYFKNEDYSTGLKEGTRQLLEQLKGGARKSVVGSKGFRSRRPYRKTRVVRRRSGGGLGFIGTSIIVIMVLGFIFLFVVFRFITGFGGGGRRRGYYDDGYGYGGGSGWGSFLGGSMLGYFLGSSWGSRGGGYYDSYGYGDEDSFTFGSSDSYDDGGGSSWDTSDSGFFDSGGSDWGSGSFDGDGDSGEW
ncbi:TPM domain-containing protein [Candidatus Riflebacteria bacterium]